MTFSAKCWKLRLAALAVVASLLTGCGTSGSDHVVTRACPPVVGTAFQTRAAAEVEMLPAGSALAEMLSDYAVMRNQARAGQAP